MPLLTSRNMGQNGAIHVLVFTDTFLETSGVGTYYRTLIDMCRERKDVRITVICPDPAAADDFAPTDEVITVKPWLRCRFPFYRDVTVGYYPESNLRRLMRAIPGAKIAHIASPGPLGMAGARAARKEGIPIVGCYHTDMRMRGRVYGRAALGPPGQWLGEKFARYCDVLAYRHCAGLYAPSPAASSMAKGLVTGETQTIANPVDIRRFHPGDTREGWFRERYRKDGRVLVSVVGRVTKEKSVERICELIAHDERISLVFVGDGPDSPAFKRRWGVEVTGFLQGRELLDAYQQSDVYVQISTSETFGLCLAEALACGLPGVVLRAPGLAENLPPDSGVDVLEPDELDTLGDRVVALGTDPARHREYARLAREFAGACASDGMIDKWTEFHRAFAR